MTDAPIDDANVNAAFITIADVKVDGQSIEGFQKITVEISSLTNGQTQSLGDLDLSSGSKSDIVLVLANENAAGDGPGNYIVNAESEVKALTMASNEISLNDSFIVEETNDNKLVLDFDLRKAIVANGTSDFKFVSNSELSNSVRAVNTVNAGTISGTVTGDSSAKTVLYAYKKGTFSNSESQANGSGVQFANAVSSTVVNSDNFSLHFMEGGEYELHFASYEDTDSNGSLEFQGLLEASTSSELSLSNLSVTANTQVSIAVIITGFLGL